MLRLYIAMYGGWPSIYFSMLIDALRYENYHGAGQWRLRRSVKSCLCNR